MEEELVYKEFLESGAILRGHFLLSSGLHSDVYIQCALVLKNTRRSVMLCRILCDKIYDVVKDGIDLVVAPAMGGVIVGYEVARNLGTDFVFFERVQNKFVLKRGFEITKNARVLIVEDVLTTGSSSLEVIELVEKAGANVIAEAVLVDRSRSLHSIKCPIISLIKIDAQFFSKDNLPDDLKSVPVLRLGTKVVEQ